MSAANEYGRRLAAFLRERRDAAKENPWFDRGLYVFVGVVVLDQLSKLWVLHGLKLPERPYRKIELSGVFDLSYVENTGVSFGMLSGGGARWALTVFSLGVTVALLGWLASVTRPLAALGVAIIAGGAFGNLIDRAAYGFVVDFLDFSGLMFPWVFNIADAAINVGVGALILDMVLEGREERNSA